jgi:hypothetical protein
MFLQGSDGIGNMLTAKVLINALQLHGKGDSRHFTLLRTCFFLPVMEIKNTLPVTYFQFHVTCFTLQRFAFVSIQGLYGLAQNPSIEEKYPEISLRVTTDLRSNRGRLSNATKGIIDRRSESESQLGWQYKVECENATQWNVQVKCRIKCHGEHKFECESELAVQSKIECEYDCQWSVECECKVECKYKIEREVIASNVWAALAGEKGRSSNEKIESAESRAPMPMSL